MILSSNLSRVVAIRGPRFDSSNNRFEQLSDLYLRSTLRRGENLKSGSRYVKGLDIILVTVCCMCPSALASLQLYSDLFFLVGWRRASLSGSGVIYVQFLNLLFDPIPTLRLMIPNFL